MVANKETPEYGMIPYCEVDGIRTFSDSFIMELYDRMVEEGTVEVTLYSGNITTREEYLKAIKYGLNKLWIVLKDDELVGMIWLNNFADRSADIHACMFKDAWGRYTVGPSKYALNQLLNTPNAEGEYTLDTLVGKIPVENQHMVRFSKKVGMSVVGIIPMAMYNGKTGKSVDCVITYINRTAGME